MRAKAALPLLQVGVLYWLLFLHAEMLWTCWIVLKHMPCIIAQISASHKGDSKAIKAVSFMVVGLGDILPCMILMLLSSCVVPVAFLSTRERCYINALYYYALDLGSCCCMLASLLPNLHKCFMPEVSVFGRLVACKRERKTDDILHCCAFCVHVSWDNWE